MMKTVRNASLYYSLSKIAFLKNWFVKELTIVLQILYRDLERQDDFCIFVKNKK